MGVMGSVWVVIEVTKDSYKAPKPFKTNVTYSLSKRGEQVATRVSARCLTLLKCSVIVCSPLDRLVN